MIGRILGTLGGLALALTSGYAIYRMVDMLISGILGSSVLMVIAGGVLLYLFLGLAICGVIIGGVIAVACALD